MNQRFDLNNFTSFNCENNSDLILVVSNSLTEPKKNFSVHSSIIYNSSPIFQSLIDSNRNIIQKMISQYQKPEIFIECPPEIFHLILIYIYENKVTISSVPKCLLLLKASIQFQLNNLIFICLTFLYEKVNQVNLIEILNCLYELINHSNLFFTNSNCENFYFKKFLNDQTETTSNLFKKNECHLNKKSQDYGHLYPELNESILSYTNFNKDFHCLNLNLPYEPKSFLNSHEQQNKCNYNVLVNKIILKCFTVLDENADSILNSKTISYIDYSLLVDILSRDTLNITSELTTFNLVEEWSNQACLKFNKKLTSENKRLFANKALYLVRYLTMSKDEFLVGPYVSDILKNEEKTILLNSLSCGYLSYESILNNENNSRKLFFEQSNTINLDYLNDDCQNYDIQWLFLEHKMNIKRKYCKPICANNLKKNLNNNYSSKKLFMEKSSNYSGSIIRKEKSKSKRIFNNISDFFVRLINILG